MKNQWTNFITGTVTITIKGKGIERFLNNCFRQRLLLTNIQRIDEQCVKATILLHDIPTIRYLVRQSECKIYFSRKNGLPFLVKRMWKNSGFVIGIGVFLVLIMMLSNMIWDIKIAGAKPHTEYQILKELDKMGVKRGKLQFFMDDPDTIQRKLTNNIDSITWIGVELRGTTFHFQVVEKTQPKQPKTVSPSDIVAKKKAVITKLFIEKGQPLVKVNDFVQPGQLLVSGTIGKEDYQRTVGAKGEIYGETWYKSVVEIPLKTNFRVLTGKDFTKYAFYLGNIRVPIWGFFQNETYKKAKVEELKKPVYFLKWRLPFAYETITTREEEEVTREYNVQQAIEKGKEIGRKELISKLDADAKIKGEKVLHQTNDNGKVKLTIYYQVIENIATTQPIIQGD
ncbi:sporulation protein YqfD [Bacillus songklensis]|uniref:Sporulation protein YqfD n=1 Tax=Bacillus songklensis TaxID=1069116 RepID=A0ABV8B188_9BACI